MSVQIDEDADMLSAYSVDHWEHPDPPEELADLPNARMVLDTVTRYTGWYTLEVGRLLDRFPAH
ncbi:hypothetical protein AURDEDRAFT_177564 [Auricularia subglabra TFB-10046 SS5]|uniref:Uncharacterized protein n=1 Tax=Auricularia subglabra (strain TFB-10046 / SS5) TaxID=717982 RepID=J0LAB3_AURST|nr:hypothetical protein AURDEDRAFT_177564 [Auricularia subglabra TFB-10046 SS5]